MTHDVHTSPMMRMSSIDTARILYDLHPLIRGDANESGPNVSYATGVDEDFDRFSIGVLWISIDVR